MLEVIDWLIVQITRLWRVTESIWFWTNMIQIRIKLRKILNFKVNFKLINYYSFYKAGFAIYESMW